MATKRKPFISMPAFTEGAKQLEKETKLRVGNISEVKKEISLTDRVEEASNEKSSTSQNVSQENITNANEETHNSEQPVTKKEKGKRQRKRFANTLDQYVPAKHIKSGAMSTVNIHEKILVNFKLMSIENKMSVEDLVNLAAYSFLIQTKQLKDELIKPFEL